MPSISVLTSTKVNGLPSRTPASHTNSGNIRWNRKHVRSTEYTGIVFEALGFQWDRTRVPNTIPVYSVDRTCFRFHRMLPEFVWDAGVLEGNPLTFVEVKTL